MRRILAIAVALLVIALIVLGFVVVQIVQKTGVTGVGTPTSTSTSTTTTTVATGMPRVQGAQLEDAQGHPFLLRGAQIESAFNYIKRWQSSERPTTTLNSQTFNAMTHDWHMNALRLPLSNWLYAKYTSDYMSQLDQVVQQANAAGLYVVLDLHDDNKAGSPYGESATFPKVEDLDFWKAIATHYKNNPMIMYDVYNEPKTPNWNAWLHGVSGTKEIGFQDLIDGIRSVGAQQVIVVEPGSAGGGANTTEGGGWSSFNVTINDPNIMYSLHVYDGILFNAQQQDAKWGPILNHHPLYYGEWAFLPNAYGSSHCQNLPTAPAQSNQVVSNFLNYMASRNASWTAWAFTPNHLIQNFTSYAPTTLNVAWQCGNAKATVGMGEDIKNYLTTGHI